MKLVWYVCNSRHGGDESHLRSRVKYCAKKINSYCLRFVCYPNGETQAFLQTKPPLRENDLGYMLDIRKCKELFMVIYKQLQYLQRRDLFEVTPASMDAIDARIIDENTFLLGVPVIRYEHARSLESKYADLLPVRLTSVPSSWAPQAVLRDHPKYR